MWLEHESTHVYAGTSTDDDMVEMNISKEVAVDLLGFINQQLSVMRTLKIHHMSQLSLAMEELHTALETILPIDVPEQETEPPF